MYRSGEGLSALLEGLDLRMDYGADGAQRMYLEGEDISQAIRAHQVSGLASKVSAIPEVRAFLLDFQRRQAREHSVVMDGRVSWLTISRRIPARYSPLVMNSRVEATLGK